MQIIQRYRVTAIRCHFVSLHSALQHAAVNPLLLLNVTVHEARAVVFLLKPFRLFQSMQVYGM